MVWRRMGERNILGRSRVASPMLRRAFAARSQGMQVAARERRGLKPRRNAAGARERAGVASRQVSTSRGRVLRSRALIASFIGAFTITVVGLLMTTLIVRAKAGEIGAAADAITTNAAPSVEELSSIRTTLRHMEVALSDYVDEVALEDPGASSAPLPETVARDRSDLRRDWDRYRRLPAFPKERRLTPDLDASLSELDRAVDRVLTAARGSDRRAAKKLFDRELKSRFDDVGGRLHEATAINVAASADAAAQIATTREDMQHLSNALYGAWLFFAAAAAAVAVRLVRQYTSVTEGQIAELELFAGRLAHDMRGPLSSVGLAVALSERRAADDKSRELLSRAHRTLVRVGELMDGLLLLAKLVQTPHVGAPADVKDVLEDVVANYRPIAKEKDVELELDAVTTCSVACSAGVLTNMIGNLVDNAIKYMGDAPVRSVTIGTTDRGQKFRIRVEDTGPGIPISAQERVFEQYARAAPADVQGFGLGLATVKRLAEVLGGGTGMQSRPGCGSMFWIELPKAQQQ